MHLNFYQRVQIALLSVKRSNRVIVHRCDPAIVLIVLACAPPQESISGLA